MPENTGQAPEPKPEPKPEKPSTPPEEPVQGNEGKVRGRRFVKYQELSKDELIRMLMRINKRLSRISRELREVTDILYYGYTQGGAPQGQGQYKNNSEYRRNNRKNYGGYGNRQYKRRSEDEDDVNYD